MLSAMKSAVNTAVLKLPKSIRGMTMREFMGEHGGDTALVLEKERKAQKCVALAGG